MGLSEKSESPFFVQRNSEENDFDLVLTLFLIRVRLNFENPNWRQEEMNTVYFPKKNILGSEYSKEHIEYISLFPKFKDSWIQYYVSVADF